MDAAILDPAIVMPREPLSTLQLDSYVSPDRLRKSLDVDPKPQDITQPQSGPDPAQGHSPLQPSRPDPAESFPIPADPSPDLQPAHNPPDVQIPLPEPPPTDSHLSEQQTIAQDAQINELNAARRLNDLPPITDPDALVEAFLADPSSYASYATHVIQPNDPRTSEFKDAIKDEDELLIDIACLRQSYTTGELRSFYCIDTSCNPADAFTKNAPCPALSEIERAGVIKHKVLFSLAHGQLC